MTTVNISSCLAGANAFYADPEYQEKTIRELSSASRVSQIGYQTEIETKTCRVFKEVISWVVFPIKIYQALHNLAGYAFLPATLQSVQVPEVSARELMDSEWKYKKITIEVDGNLVDAVIMGKPETLNNGRWTIYSTGNGGYLENHLFSSENKRFLEETASNMIFFNYPGVSESSMARGSYLRDAMEKSYIGILRFLEDAENGIGAREIIGYGHSIGGGVQGDALRHHTLRSDIKYVFIKDRTFSTMYDEVAFLVNKVVALASWILGWNISSVESSRALNAPEIIIQTARCPRNEQVDLTLQRGLLAESDGVIGIRASLAYSLLQDEIYSIDRKRFIGIPEGHNQCISNMSAIGRATRVLLTS